MGIRVKSVQYRVIKVCIKGKCPVSRNCKLRDKRTGRHNLKRIWIAYSTGGEESIFICERVHA